MEALGALIVSHLTTSHRHTPPIRIGALVMLAGEVVSCCSVAISSAQERAITGMLMRTP